MRIVVQAEVDQLVPAEQEPLQPEQEWEEEQGHDQQGREVGPAVVTDGEPEFIRCHVRWTEEGAGRKLSGFETLSVQIRTPFPEGFR
jgi:hypothetical protein